MKQTVNEYMFEQAFNAAGRGEQFSYEGKRALFEYLEDLEYLRDNTQVVEFDGGVIIQQF